MMDSVISVSEPGNYIVYYSVLALILGLAVASGRHAFCHYSCWMAPMAVIEDGGADDVGPGGEGLGQIDRVGLGPAGVGGRGAPLDAPAVDLELVAAFGRDPAGGAAGFRLEIQLQTKKHESVGEGAA